MKRTYLYVACCFLVFQGTALADEYLQGEIVSSFADRLDLTAGDKVIINVGKNLGVAKGDIAKIARRGAEDPLTNTLGQCAIIETEDASAVCEIIRNKMEMHRGDAVFLPATKPYADVAIYPLALKTLQSLVNPYHPSKKLSVYVYNIFDEKNDVTALSERIRREVVEVLRQKSRITLADSGAAMEAFYPADDMRWVNDVKQVMKKTNVDVLLTGRYSLQKDRLVMSIYKIDLRGDDRRISHAVQRQENYAQMGAGIQIPYRQIEKKEQVFCSFVLKPVAYVPMKDEKPALIRFEADGNPFTEYGMRRDDFNIVIPVDVLVKVGNESFALSANKAHQLVTLTKGTQRVTVSFRRGYYFNENLLYKSRTLIAKEVLLDVRKSNNILVDLTVDPLPDKPPITIQVFDSVGKERQILRPIRRLDADTIVETFKD
jgi:hypothetical protein